MHGGQHHRASSDFHGDTGWRATKLDNDHTGGENGSDQLGHDDRKHSEKSHRAQRARARLELGEMKLFAVDGIDLHVVKDKV